MGIRVTEFYLPKEYSMNLKMIFSSPTGISWSFRSIGNMQLTDLMFQGKKVWLLESLQFGKGGFLGILQKDLQA